MAEQSDLYTSNGHINVGGLPNGDVWQYKVDGGSWTNGSGSSFLVSGDGVHQVQARVSDGGTWYQSSAFSFTLDTHAAALGIDTSTPAQTPGGQDSVGALVSVLTPGYIAASTHIHDINGDGYGDTVTFVTFYTNASYSVQVGIDYGNGAGVFTPTGWSADYGVGCQQIQSSTMVLSADLVDMNNDGRLDIVYSGVTSLGWVENQGGGVWVNHDLTSVTPLLTQAFNFAAAGDVNGDGNVDLVVDLNGLGTPLVSILLTGDGHGNFTSAFNTQTLTGAPSFGMAAFTGGTYGFSDGVPYIADVNGDGHLDLIRGWDGAWNIQYGDGQGGFSGGPVAFDGQTFNSANNPFGDQKLLAPLAAVGDINGDGIADFMGLETSTNSPVSVVSLFSDATPITSGQLTSVVYLHSPLTLSLETDQISVSDSATEVHTHTHNGLVISGAGVESAADVQLYANGQLLGSTQADTNGAYSYTWAGPVANGDYDVTVKQLDKANNLSDASAAYTIHVEAQPTSRTLIVGSTGAVWDINGDGHADVGDQAINTSSTLNLGDGAYIIHFNAIPNDWIAGNAWALNLSGFGNDDKIEIDVGAVTNGNDGLPAGDPSSYVGSPAVDAEITTLAAAESAPHYSRIDSAIAAIWNSGSGIATGVAAAGTDALSGKDAVYYFDQLGTTASHEGPLALITSHDANFDMSHILDHVHLIAAAG